MARCGESASGKVMDAPLDYGQSGADLEGLHAPSS